MFKLDRLSAFSDGVIAVAITLLVLGLEVPSVHEVPPKNLPDYLKDSLHPLVGYLSSFLLIGTYWLQHYAIFQYVQFANRNFIILNLLFLFCVSLVPFPTALQAAYRYDELAIVIYGGSQLACGLSLLTMWVYATKDRGMLVTDIAPNVVTSMSKRIALAPIISAIAIGMSFVSIPMSKILFLTIPVFYFSSRVFDARILPSKQDD